MKKIFSYVVALAAFAMIFTSCNKQEDYPSLLEGAYVGSNASTGYTAGLVIQTIAGGQYAYFTVASPSEANVAVTEGSFVYDAKTGKATIEPKVTITGGVQVTVQAKRGTDATISAVATQLVSGNTITYFDGEMQKGTIVK